MGTRLAASTLARGADLMPTPPVRLPPMSEAQLQDQVLRLAELCGWTLRYHTWNSQRSEAGYPDLTLCRPRDGRLLIVELKRDGRHPTVDQRAWLDGLETVKHFDVKLWRPADWPEIERTLR